MDSIRRKWLAVAGGFIAGMPALASPQDSRPRRVGVLGVAGGGTYSAWKEQFPAQFRQHGFFDGKNLELVWFDVSMEGPKGPLTFADVRAAGIRRAAEMAAAGLDCMVVNGEPQTRFLHEATRTIPIVTVVPDPVALGFARTLARPGGNVTGMHDGSEEVALKTVELFRKLIPGVACVGWIGSENFRRNGNALETALKSTGLRFRAVTLRSEEEAEARIAQEVAALKRDGCTAVDVSTAMQLTSTVVRQALAHRIAVSGPPSMEGVLFGYWATRLPEHESARRVPAIVARVLRGEKPADIPFEGPSRYHLGISLKTAARLGITVPPEILLLADEVIS